MPLAEICREVGISRVIYFSWCRRYAGLMRSEVKRLPELEAEKVRLKKIVADFIGRTECHGSNSRIARSSAALKEGSFPGLAAQCPQGESCGHSSALGR